MIEAIEISERIQAGSTFLFRFGCPQCKAEQLIAYPMGSLLCCGKNISGFELKIKHARLLCGTSRKKGRISKRLIQQLLAIQGPNCAYCQCSIENITYHVDHMLPICVGGTNDLTNLCLSCPRCNHIAGPRVFASVAAKKAYILDRTT